VVLLFDHHKDNQSPIYTVKWNFHWYNNGSS
jgi:oligoribonuclease NrnB/cAMP/cGMP phosphodiesterase (DHH superfamily)